MSAHSDSVGTLVEIAGAGARATTLTLSNPISAFPLVPCSVIAVVAAVAVKLRV